MINIKKTGSMRRKVSKNHPYKQHRPDLFKSHREAIHRHVSDGYILIALKKLKKSNLGPILKPC